jgi:hypothetical protein
MNYAAPRKREKPMFTTVCDMRSEQKVSAAFEEN